jgi:ABC-type nitrate/sulfonate/bicarbonate transport system permease component
LNGWTYFGFALFVAIWFVVAKSDLVGPLFLASPDVVFIKLVELFTHYDFLTDVLFTLYRTMAGFAISVVIGIPLGLVLGHSKVIYNMFEPLVDFFRSVPVTALFPLFLLLFTGGDQSKIAVVVFGSGLLIIVNVMYGVRHSSKTRLLLARSFGASQFTVLRKVEFFECLPYLFAGLRLAISISLAVVIITEMFLGFSDYGLGLRIYNAYEVRNVSEMYAAVVISGIIGYLLNIVIKKLEARILHWIGR